MTRATECTETVDSVSVDGYWASGGTVNVLLNAVAASGVHNVLTRTISQSPARALNDGEEGEVTVEMNLTASSLCGLCGGTVRFKINGIQWTVGANDIYQGEYYGGENGLGNMTDAWMTPWFTVN